MGRVSQLKVGHQCEGKDEAIANCLSEMPCSLRPVLFEVDMVPESELTNRSKSFLDRELFQNPGATGISGSGWRQRDMTGPK